MPTDTRSYLRDIDFYTDRIPNASPGDKIFLMRLTSNREVNNFIERQPRASKHDYNELCKALLAEYSDFGASGTLTAAMAVKQTQNELADCYYHRLRQAYFGNQNYEGMEEDKNFKALYIQNLHPNLSFLLGVSACPLTQDIRQLKTLVVNTTIRKMALMQLTVGPMTLVHPVYISPFNSIPLLLGQDLLNRLEPLIDFQRLKIWAQVRKPLPIPRPLSENHCYFIEAPPTDGLQPAYSPAWTRN
uniref:Uncharacterized protein n=1 Tax=Knipowitschia caucasica TaxID=637954 RepID=A0AAV2KJX6_KNICA